MRLRGAKLLRINHSHSEPNFGISESSKGPLISRDRFHTQTSAGHQVPRVSCFFSCEWRTSQLAPVKPSLHMHCPALHMPCRHDMPRQGSIAGNAIKTTTKKHAHAPSAAAVRGHKEGFSWYPTPCKNPLVTSQSWSSQARRRVVTSMSDMPSANSSSCGEHTTQKVHRSAQVAAHDA